MILKCSQQGECLWSVSLTIFELQAANCNLWVLSYNWTSLWVVSCEFLIRLWVGSLISLHYIKFALLVYTISSLHVKQSKSNKIIWYIPITIYTWEQPQDLLWFKWKWLGKVCKYICKSRLLTEAAVHR